MAGKGVTDKGYKFVSKKLKGTTLAEVDKDRKKNGAEDPNDKSQKFYAVTAVTIDLQTGDDIWYPGGMAILGHMINTNPHYHKPFANMSSVITICVPKNLVKLSSDAQKEWHRFEAELRKHEIEDHQKGLALAEEIVKEVAGLDVLMKTETVNEREMRAEAHRLLGKLFTKAFGGGVLEKRINAAMARFDKATGHGSVKLKTSIA